MIVGEAWGCEEEDAGGVPFVGASGKLLRGLLRQVGIAYDEAYVTNVFNLRPHPSNNIINLCGSRGEGIPGYPALSRAKYAKAEYASELDRLFEEIARVNPTLILALGATPSWALLKTSGIKSIRGAPLPFHLSGHTYKVLPTYHPAAVLRDWSLRPILLADLHKARRELEYPDIRRPQRSIWIEPTYTDLIAFECGYINSSPQLSIDIETEAEQITCIGFAPSPSIGLVVPFVDKTKPGNSYWKTLEEEVRVWQWVRKMCGLKKRIVGQNFLYDIGYLWGKYGIPVPHATDDTMLLHHSLQPEMDKGLGFLGSIYTDEASWKFMGRAKHKTLKTED